MKLRFVIPIAVLALLAAGLVSAPSPARALDHSSCAYCHSIHTPVGANLTIAATFDLVCESCHGIGTSAAPDALRHLYPSGSSNPYYDFGCRTCHTQHSSLKNRLWDNGATHLHDVGSITGVGTGTNIKLMGRDEDGTGIARIQTPLAIFDAVYDDVTPPAPCADSNLGIQVRLPPFSFGDGPPHTIMVGDRITLVNVNPATFDGTFRVKEVLDDWICFDNPNDPGTYSSTDLIGRGTDSSITNGWAFSAGWRNRARVRSADWSAGTATIDIWGAPHSIVVGEDITVSGADPAGYNGTYPVTAVTSGSVSYAVSDPGVYVSGGMMEYEGSMKSITDAIHDSINGEITFSVTSDISAMQIPPSATVTNGRVTWKHGGWKATITLSQDIGIQVGDAVVVSDVVPAGYNGTFTVTAVSGLDITYVVPSDPGFYSSGGVAQSGFGDLITVFGIVSAGPGSFNGKWAVKALSPPDTITVECPPLHRLDPLPEYVCDLTDAAWDPGAYDAILSQGLIQSTGTMRPVVFESRGQGFDDHYMHSFSDQDADVDGVMDGACELCHTVTSKKLNDDFEDSHNSGKSCSLSCHPHGIGFDKGNFGGHSPMP